MGWSDIDKIVGFLADIKHLGSRRDDDFVDRLNHRYTTVLFISFAIIITTKAYVGEPISCWTPATYTNAHVDYANKVCWVSNTYFLPFNTKNIPEGTEKQEVIGYYQWVPALLLLQAIFFHIPCTIWRTFSRRFGINIKLLMEAGASVHKASSDQTRQDRIKIMSNLMDVYLKRDLGKKKGCCTRLRRFLAKCMLCCGMAYGNYASFLYLFTKVLYLLNLIGQLFALNYFLGTDYHLYGVKVIMSLIKGEKLGSSKVFPRVTLCDFSIRQLGNINRHTVQCVLPINLFNEKIYLFIWFWLLFLILATVSSLLHWIYKCICRRWQLKYITQHLKHFSKTYVENKAGIKRFVLKYLQPDGVFLIQLVSINVGGLIAGELCVGLWNVYRKDNSLVFESIRETNLQENKRISLHNDVP